MYCQEALEIQEKIFGTEHLTTTTYNEIADIYHRRGEYESALTWYSKSFRVFLTVLGGMHPDTLSVEDEMATAHSKAGLAGSFEDWLSDQ